MQFSDTTNKNGMIQAFEFWTRQPDGTVTGTALKQATARINAAFDRIMPLLIANNDSIRWDDTNHTTQRPSVIINISNGLDGYSVLADSEGTSILNITNVSAFTSATATSYTQLDRIAADSPLVPEILQNTTFGVPTHFLEHGNRIYLYPNPNYDAADGLYIVFERNHIQFVSTDTTKEPGIPAPFHELLVWYAALDWVAVNRTNDSTLLLELRSRISSKEEELRRIISLRSPTRIRITAGEINGR